MSLQPALGHQPSHTQATRVVWPLFPPTLSSQPPPLILSSLPHTFLLPIPIPFFSQHPIHRARRPLPELQRASPPPSFLSPLPLSSFSFPLSMRRSTQGASPLLPPPPRLSSRHRRLRVRQPLLRSAGSMSPSRRCPSSVPDLACPRPSASPATSAGTLPTASSTCVRTTMTSPPSTVWAVPWPCSRGPPRGQASRRRRERQ